MLLMLFSSTKNPAEGEEGEGSGRVEVVDVLLLCLGCGTVYGVYWAS